MMALDHAPDHLFLLSIHLQGIVDPLLPIYGTDIVDINQTPHLER